MVSKAVQQRFTDRGVRAITRRSGRRAFLREMASPAASEACVVLGDGPWAQGGAPSSRASRAVPAITTVPSVAAPPLLAGADVVQSDSTSIEVVRRIDLARDRLIDDHRLDGRAVLPVAAALELMMEVAHLGWPGLVVSGVDEFRLLHGIVVGDEGNQLRITARRESDPTESAPKLTLEIIDGARKHASSRATVTLDSALPARPRFEMLTASEMKPFGLSAPEAYDRFLFHGPLLRGIESIDGIGERGMVATTRAVTPKPLHPARRPRGLGGRSRLDRQRLPTRDPMGASPSRHDPPPGGDPASPQVCPARWRKDPLRLPGATEAGGHVLETQYAFLTLEGQLLALIEGMELSCSSALNRLAGSAAGALGV